MNEPEIYTYERPESSASRYYESTFGKSSGLTPLAKIGLSNKRVRELTAHMRPEPGSVAPVEVHPARKPEDWPAIKAEALARFVRGETPKDIAQTLDISWATLRGWLSRANLGKKQRKV